MVELRLQLPIPLIRNGALTINRFLISKKRKKMKKIEYVAPEMEVFKISSNAALLAGSDNIKEDGEITPTPSNPSDDDWGSDY